MTIIRQLIWQLISNILISLRNQPATRKQIYALKMRKPLSFNL
jgi:hypothetical protein